MKDINTEAFAELVALKTELPVVVKFGASWCPPCQEYAPILDELHDDPDTDFVIVSVDIDNDRDLALHMGVESVPTTFVIHDGVALDSREGVLSATELKGWVKSTCDQPALVHPRRLEIPNE